MRQLEHQHPKLGQEEGEVEGETHVAQGANEVGREEGAWEGRHPCEQHQQDFPLRWYSPEYLSDLALVRERSVEVLQLMPVQQQWMQQ